MQVADYIGYVVSEGDKFAAAADKGDLDVEVSACDGWDMRTLVRHLGLIHLWAAGNVAFTQDDWLDADDIPDMARYWPELGSSWPDDSELVSWYRQTKANLVRVLESAPADHQCFSFLPAPTPVTMWSRRQASEIAIHRFDAENARGIPSHFEPEFAADMLDELLSGFASRPRAEGAKRSKSSPSGSSMCTPTTSTSTGTSRLDREPSRPLATVATPTSPSRRPLPSCTCSMWNRADDSTGTLTGDAGLMDLWRESCPRSLVGGRVAAKCSSGQANASPNEATPPAATTVRRIGDRSAGHRPMNQARNWFQSGADDGRNARRRSHSHRSRATSDRPRGTRRDDPRPGLGGMTTAYMHYPTGLDFCPLLEGLERDHCQCPHRGYVIEGRVHVDYEDSSEEAVSPDELYRPAVRIVVAFPA